MTIQQLSYLLEVYKAGSFSQAAKNLYITQSAISNAVIGLEKEIGDTIFVRSKKGLVPTARGMDVINHAKRACESINQITAPKTPVKKSVRIGSHSYGPAHNAFLRLLDENRGRKDIEFSFVDTRGGDYLERLLNYELDVVLFFNIASHTPGRLENVKTHDLHYEILETIPAVVGIGPKHPLYNTTNLDVRELSKYKLLQSSEGGIASVKSIGAYLPVRKENLLLVCGSALQRKVLEEGHAFAVKRKPAKPDPNDKLRYIPIEGLNYLVYYVTNPRNPQCPELDRFIDLLKEEVALKNGE